MKHYSMWVNGRLIGSSSKKYFDVINPFNQRVIGKVPLGNEKDVCKAISVARVAFDNGSWSGLTPGERSEALYKLASVLEKNSSRLARLESLNQGKTIKYATDSDFPFLIDNLKYFAGACRNLEGKAGGEYTGSGTSFIRREPVGVVSCIIPWNYPLFIGIWQLAPALAAGCTVVAKPASLTPLTLLEFAKLTKGILPDGVLNVVTGSGSEIGHEMVTNSKVDMVSLTGDVNTGRKVMKMASGSLKKLHLELGGKAPMIVLDDCDLDYAAQGAVVGAFWNGGQDCTAVTRVYIPSKLHNKFVSLLKKYTLKFKLGDQLSKKTDMGPLVSKSHLEKVESYVIQGKREGVKIVCGGKRPSGNKFGSGFFFEPTILTNVKHHSRICKDEIFGPILAVFKYDKLDDAIFKSNDVDYGLASSVYGKDIHKCIYVANRLKFGCVWINEHGALASEMPHGGYKQSGFGKDLSMYSLEEYTNIKHVYIDQDGNSRKSWHYVVYGKP